MNETMSFNKPEDLWISYKELKGTVWKYLNHSQEQETTVELENTLRKHKQSFFSLLQCPPRTTAAREELKKGMVEGINVRGIGHQILSNELYQETIILSDMFEINEFVALDLLCTAQMQMPYYPSLPRGLVAVLLYYDGRKALVTSLLYLVQARSGVQWSVDLNTSLSKFISEYTDQLMEGGLFNRIFELLRSLDLSKEIGKLQQNLALGGPKHRRQVIDLFKDIRNILAEIVFSWSSQSGLPKIPTLALINYLREAKIEGEASGNIDDVNLYLEAALLSALDISILHTREDGEEAIQLLPVFSDSTYISTIMNEFSISKPKWVCEGLQALSTFGLAVCISSLRDVPQSFKFQEAINKEESFVDSAIEMNVFAFLHNVVLENKTLFKEQFLYKRFHNLITDFIFSMYSKVKDLRMKADEIGRTMQVYIREGLDVPASLPRYFEYFLLTIGKLYSNDVLNTGYASQYWSPVESSSTQSTSYRTSPRSVALFKFVRLAGDVLPTTGLLCLKLFNKFLNQYEPKPSDFPAIQNEFSSPPGYHLMLQLNSKSEMFYIIMNIIEEGNRFFDSYVSFQGQEYLKNCVLTSLDIIHRVLVLQSRFFSFLASSSTSVILTSFNKLLMSMNQHTGKPDYCINVAKYVTYQLYLPKHAYVAVKILTHINSSSVAHSQFMNILMSVDHAKELIRSGFVDCLDSTTEDDETIENTKKEILKLTKQCLSYNAPNLTHFLMGFDIKRDVSKTEFQFPGVMGFPRSCLHSIISVMDSVINLSSSVPSPSLLESVYHQLYLLASNVKTSKPVLRFIRMNKSFYRDHLTEASKNIDKGLSQFGQVKWLLKVLAIELKVSSQIKQVSYMKQLTNFLLNMPVEESKNPDIFALMQKSALDAKLMIPEDIKLENFLSSLIPHFELTESQLEMPTWEFFDTDVLNKILQTCQKKTVPQLIDLKKLHQILYDELKSLQGTAVMGQIQAITKEIQKVLRYALEINRRAETCSALIQFTDAWRQVAEVLIIFTPTEILSTTEQQIISISLIKQLLTIVVRAQLLPEVSRLLSGAILLLADNLKKCYFRERRLEKISPVDKDETLNVLEMHHSSLKKILENFVQCIMVSDVVDGELRINLYASLVTFLQMANIEKPYEDVMFSNSLFISRLDSSKLSICDDFKIDFSDILSNFGEKLIEIICQDCIGGQEVCKILAMSSFSQIIAVSGNANWIIHFSGRGYLKHVIQSIADTESELRNILEPQAESIKALYLYMAKILLLARLAATKIGSELILEQKLFSVFSNMSVFSYHPEISKDWQRDNILEDFLPPIEQQYLQIWLPTLNICNAVLTTLGTENQSAVAQIMYFLLSHLDVVELILRSGSPDLSPMSLRELALLTSVISRTANNNLVNILENPNIVQNNRAHLYRIQKLMLSLLPKFILSEDTVKRLISHTTIDSCSFQTSERLLSAMQVMSNLLSYSRNVVANHGIEHAGVGVIFYPTLIDPLLSNFSSKNFANTNDQETSLGVIVQQLISTVNHYHQEKVTHELLMRKLEEVPDMNSADLKPYIDSTVESSELHVKREKGYEIISDRLDKKKKEINYCAFIIENSLYLIWLHLDFYMLKAIPRVENYGNRNASFKIEGTLASSTEATWKVSTDVISSLKHGLISLFNDSFTKQLLETAQDRTESDKNFIEALLRKIKRLVQFVPVK
nr:nuclear pore complex protein Nup205 [Leptinotarsa decemlineata]